jgi:ribonuclease VapC
LIVVDTSAIIAIALDEPEAEPLLTAVSNADEAFIAAPTALELEIVLRSKTGPQGPSAKQVLQQLAVEIVPFSTEHLAEAIAAFGKFGRGRHPAALNFGDCFSCGLAKALGAPLLFNGDDFARTDIPSALTP